MKQKILCMLRFFVGTREYAFKIDDIREVVRMVLLREIQRCPPFVKGMFNLRGQPILVIDLRERFGINDYKNSKTTRIIITELNSKKIGFIVDSINKIDEIIDASIFYSSESPVQIDESFIYGFVNSCEQIIPILNVQGILNSREHNIINAINETQ